MNNYRFYIKYAVLVIYLIILSGPCPVMAFVGSSWAHIYGKTDEQETGKALRILSNGTYVMLADANDFGAGSGDPWIVRLNKTGTISWQKTIGTAWPETSDDILATNDGGFIVAAHKSNDISAYDAWMIKFDAIGHITWQKQLSGTHGYIINTIRNTSDGGYIAVGSFYPLPSWNKDILVLKLDASGNITWEKLYGTIYDEWAGSIQQTSDGGYIVAGASCNTSNYIEDGLLLKLSSTGEIEWQKMYGGNNEDIFTSILQTTDNGYLVTGETRSYGAGYADIWTLRLTSTGSITWQKAFGLGNSDYGLVVRHAYDSGYLLLGYTGNYAYLAKLNDSGTILWQKKYGSGSEAYLFSLEQDISTGEIIMAGRAFILSGTLDTWVVKTDQDGTMSASACSLVQDAAVSIADSTATAADSTLAISTPELPLTSLSIAPAEAYGEDTNYCQESGFPDLVSLKPTLDDSGSTYPNGIIEPDESVHLTGTCKNIGDTNATSVTATLASNDPIVISTGSTAYPDIAAGATQNALTSYVITAPVASRPSTHWDITVIEQPTCTVAGCTNGTFSHQFHIGKSFSDVPVTNLFYRHIETVLHSGVAAGCSTTQYCPSNVVTREQMAKFVCLSMNRLRIDSCDTIWCDGLFNDVTSSNPFCPYIEGLYDASVISGCQASPLSYCPSSIVQRQTMAKFICSGMEAANTGSCPTSTCTGIFNDVGTGNPFCSYIESLYTHSIISGCQSSPLLYCPNNNVNREQMAKFLVNGFGLSF